MTNLNATFSALADPTRRAILARLALGETSVMELAKPFAMSLPAVSKHLKVLERAGLIARSREAQWRPCRIEPRALKEVDDWLEHYRRFYDESFDRLGDYLKKLQAKEPAKDPKGKAPQSQEYRTWPQKIALDLDSDPRSIVGTREYDAPRDLVFSAFTDPNHLAQWWGPNGFSTTTPELRHAAGRRLALRHARP